MEQLEQVNRAQAALNALRAALIDVGPRIGPVLERLELVDDTFIACVSEDYTLDETTGLWVEDGGQDD